LAGGGGAVRLELPLGAVEQALKKVMVAMTRLIFIRIPCVDPNLFERRDEEMFLSVK
jgi:hypothetical protein